MSYLFDTNAISEVFKPRPNPEYLEWLRTVPHFKRVPDLDLKTIRTGVQK